MSFYFPNITNHWNMITKEQVITTKPELLEMTSLKGRFICLVHVVATPVKAYCSLGKLLMTALGIINSLAAILTLNASPKAFIFIVTRLIDIPGGIILLPFALVANVVRGIVGVIIYPGAMIRDESMYASCKNFDRWSAEHKLLKRTLINY